MASELLPTGEIFAPGGSAPAYAIGLLERACGLGVDESCLRLAAYRVSHDEGRHAGKQLLQRLCAEQSEVRACALLGELFDDAAAAQRACSAGLERSCVRLAVIARETDVEAATRLLEGYCTSGIGMACYQRARWAKEQRSDPTYWAGLACRDGVMVGCEFEAVYFFDEALRSGAPAPCVDITSPARVACQAGLAPACALRDLCSSASATHMPESSASSCEGDDGFVCYVRTVLEATRAAQTFPNFPRRFVPQLKRACRLGYVPACLAVASHVLEFNEDRRLRKEAIHHLQRGCDDGIGVACHRLGSVYTESRDVPADVRFAASLMESACEQSVRDSCERLAELLTRLQSEPADVVHDAGTP